MSADDATTAPGQLLALAASATHALAVGLVEVLLLRALLGRPIDHRSGRAIVISGILAFGLLQLANLLVYARFPPRLQCHRLLDPGAGPCSWLACLSAVTWRRRRAPGGRQRQHPPVHLLRRHRRGRGTIQRMKPDGRVQRAEVGRRRVSEALVDLVVEHGRLPRVDEVARRAGVGRRSVFRYFDGVASLEVETARAMRDSMTARVPLPTPRGSLDLRVASLVRHRARLYEHVTPVRRFLEAARQRGNRAFDGFLDDGRRQLRANLVAMLAPELSARPGLVPSLELLTSWEAWVALREGQQCSPRAAARVLLDTIRALLGASADRVTTRRRPGSAPAGPRATSRGPAARAR